MIHLFSCYVNLHHLHCLQPGDIEVDSSGDEEEVDQELLEWGEAGKIFGLLAGTDEMDEEEQWENCRRD